MTLVVVVVLVVVLVVVVIQYCQGSLFGFPNFADTS
jgi:hypothetical protein